MILFSYSKLNGGEFIPHLDTLRHINRIIRRIGLPVNYSKGFNPHMLVFMSSPIALGLKSTSEYCLIDTNAYIEDFVNKFNLNSPRGIKCVNAYKVNKKLNIASDITSACFSVTGFEFIDVNSILKSDSFIVTDKRGNVKNVRDKILSLSFENGILNCQLKFGNEGLRIDTFTNKLLESFKGEHINAVKTDVKFLNNIEIKEYLEQN